jgi:hypothetical protein
MREREGSSRTTERRGHGARQRPVGATRSAHGGEGSGSARAGKKAGEREREGEVAVRWDPPDGGARW